MTGRSTTRARGPASRPITGVYRERSLLLLKGRLCVLRCILLRRRSIVALLRQLRQVLLVVLLVSPAPAGAAACVAAAAPPSCPAYCWAWARAVSSGSLGHELPNVLLNGVLLDDAHREVDVLHAVIATSTKEDHGQEHDDQQSATDSMIIITLSPEFPSPSPLVSTGGDHSPVTGS